MMGLPTCREVALALSKESDQTTRLRRSLSVRMHLMICAGCRGYARQFDWLRHALQRLQKAAGPAHLTEAAHARIAEPLGRDGTG